MDFLQANPGHLQVLEAFKAFDKDGDGRIEPRELSSVLQVLDPHVWTDDAINALIESVDTGCDGYIQFAEFLQWCFGADAEQRMILCKSAVMASREWRPCIRKLDLARPVGVDDPPESLSDAKLQEYLLDEDCHGWCVCVSRLNAKKQAVLQNGLVVHVFPDDLPHLENLLTDTPDGLCVVGDLGRCERPTLPNFIIVNFEYENFGYADPPPNDADDPALERYRADEDGDGWFVHVVRMNEKARQAILSNGQPVDMRPDQVKLLQGLLDACPRGKIVVGLLLDV